MTPALISAEIERLATKVDAGTMSSRDALDAAYALGAESERLDAMHRACEDYSRARAARETALRKPGSAPPGQK
jgi:hypothetical protein